MPAPIDISAALGSDPGVGVGPAPAPGGSTDFGLDDPTTGIEAKDDTGAEGADDASGDGETDVDPEFKTLATDLFPDWEEADFAKLQRLIDLRAGKGDMDMEMP